jgi:uncharacterized membrane protein
MRGPATTPGASPPGTTRGAAAPASLEAALAHVLQIGTYVSIGLVGIGSVLLIAGGTSPLAGAPALSLEQLPADLLAGRPAGFLWLGILGVLATPGLRVVRALVGFWRRGEPRMAGIALAVLVVIAAGVIVGVMAG